MTKKYMPTIGVIDMDSLIYKAGFASQKTTYYFKDKTTNEVLSIKFKSAELAKNWLDVQGEFFDVSNYERVTTTEVLSEKIGFKKLDQLIDKHKKLAGETVKKFEFWLTPTGSKRKALKGIEDKYQKSREGTIKPHNHEAIRAYAETLPNVFIAPKGYEADQVVVNKGQRLGEKGVIISLDKDMAIAENCWVIITDKDTGEGEPMWNDSLGWVEVKKLKSSNKGIGGGFLFLLFLAIAGDTADHYKGCKGMGVVKTANFLKDFKSKEEAIKACLELYKDTYGEYYYYTSWDGQEVEISYKELLQQHIRMAFMQSPYISDPENRKDFYINEYI